MSRLHCWRSDPTAPGGGAETVGVTLGRSWAIRGGLSPPAPADGAKRSLLLKRTAVTKELECDPVNSSGPNLTWDHMFECP